MFMSEHHKTCISLLNSWEVKKCLNVIACKTNKYFNTSSMHWVTQSDKRFVEKATFGSTEYRMKRM